MHTIKVMAAGFALLAACLIIGRYAASSHPAAGIALGAKVFVALWFVAAAVNTWIGVSKAGYSIGDELPVFLIVFLVPASVAVFAWWKAAQS